MELLSLLLDFADAVSAGVAIAAFWYAWVRPSDRGALPPPGPSDPEELERFLQRASLIKPSGRRLT